MALHTTRRRVLAGVGLAAAAGTALLSPGRPAGAPDLARPLPTGTWPVAGHDPARTKHAPDATPPATDIRVAWTAAVPLSTWNPTVTVDEDTVYVTEPDGVTALDAADGRIRWRFDRADHWPPDGTEIKVGPIVAGDHVLVVTAAAVLALDAATGRIRWARDLRTDRRQVNGSVAALLVAGGIVGVGLAFELRSLVFLGSLLGLAVVGGLATLGVLASDVVSNGGDNTRGRG